MERETAVIMRWLAAGDRGDVDAFDALMHVDAVIHAPRGLSTDGSEAEKKVWLEALAAMPDLRHACRPIEVGMPEKEAHPSHDEQCAGGVPTGRGGWTRSLLASKRRS